MTLPLPRVPVDRSTLPVPGPEGAFSFPNIATATLSNGLTIRAIAHRSVPVVAMALLVPGGASTDPATHQGLASLTADLLDEGSGGQSALEVSDRIARIGGDLDVEVGPDATVIGLTTLERFLETGLGLVHELATAPNLAEEDFARVRTLRVERLRQLRDHAPALAERAFAQVIYGAHAYGHLGLGTVASLSALTVDDIRTFHRAMFQPAGATLIIVGDRTETALIEAGRRAFEGWTGDVTALPIDREAALQPPPAMPSSRLVVVEREGSAQTEIRIGHVTAARDTPDYHAMVLLNTILGGQFVSRLNLNLREDKGYTYGVRTGFDLRRGEGPFLLQTSVGSEVTVPALRESFAEIAGIVGDRPVTADELSLGLASVTLGYPRGFETAQQVARSVAQLALHHLSDRYLEEFVPRLRAVTLDEIARVARLYLRPEKMTTVLVGDLAKIGDGLPQLGLGEPVLMRPEV